MTRFPALMQKVAAEPPGEAGVRSYDKAQATTRKTVAERIRRAAGVAADVAERLLKAPLPGHTLTQGRVNKQASTQFPTLMRKVAVDTARLKQRVAAKGHAIPQSEREALMRSGLEQEGRETRRLGPGAWFTRGLLAAGTTAYGALHGGGVRGAAGGAVLAGAGLALDKRRRNIEADRLEATARDPEAIRALVNRYRSTPKWLRRDADIRRQQVAASQGSFGSLGISINRREHTDQHRAFLHSQARTPAEK